jgi:hypothetical protein
LARTEGGWPAWRDNLWEERGALAGVLLITVLAKGAALLPGYSIDDWATIASGDAVGLHQDVLRKARFGHWLFLQLGAALELEPNPARILHVTLAIVAYSVFGLTVVRFWGVRERGWLPVAAASLVANHPYTAEIFTFRIGLPLAAIVIAVLALLLWLATRPRFHLLLPSLGFAFAISCYQIALHFGGMVALCGVAIGLTRDPSLASEPPGASQPRPRLIDLAVVRLALVMALGSFWYWLALVVPGSPARRQGFEVDYLAPQQLPQRLVEAGRAVGATFLRPNVLVPRPVNLVFLGVVAALLGALAWRVARSRLRARALGLAAAIVALLGLGALWSCGLFLIFEHLWLSPRSMAHIGVLWAGCLLLLARLAPARWARAVLGLAGALIVLVFVGVNQHIFEEQRRLNMRDLNKANRIVARIEELDPAAAVRRVAVVGGHAWYPVGPQRTMWGDLNVSAFAPEWSKVAVLREASGLDWLWATDPAEKEAALAYCAAVDPWPAADSVAVRGEVAYLCLERPAAPAPAEN